MRIPEQYASDQLGCSRWGTQATVQTPLGLFSLFPSFGFSTLDQASVFLVHLPPQ